jgi:hypothetical protein
LPAITCKPVLSVHGVKRITLAKAPF